MSLPMVMTIQSVIQSSIIHYSNNPINNGTDPYPPATGQSGPRHAIGTFIPFINQLMVIPINPAPLPPLPTSLTSGSEMPDRPLYLLMSPPHPQIPTAGPHLPTERLSLEGTGTGSGTGQHGAGGSPVPTLPTPPTPAQVEWVPACLPPGNHTTLPSPLVEDLPTYSYACLCLHCLPCLCPTMPFPPSLTTLPHTHTHTPDHSLMVWEDLPFPSLFTFSLCRWWSPCLALHTRLTCPGALPFPTPLALPLPPLPLPGEFLGIALPTCCR